jgi:hypothetical protein
MYCVKDKRLYRVDGMAFGNVLRQEDTIVFESACDYTHALSEGTVSQYKTVLIYMRDEELEDGCYRFRRERLVKIPDEWVGIKPSPRTIRQRNTISRRTRKEK